MSATITLKNVPDHIYQELKNVAEVHRRSLNSEIIACLEQAVFPARILPDERLARARHLRAELAPQAFNAEDISAAIQQGRP